MRQIQTIFILVLALMLAACATTELRKSLAQAESAYAAAVETAIDLREFGLLDDETAQELTPYFIRANELLEQANEYIVSGQAEEAQQTIREAEVLLSAIARQLRDP